MSDMLPCVLPHSQRVHLAPLFTAPALCRPDGPPPTWYSPYRQMGHSDEQCPRCVALGGTTLKVADGHGRDAIGIDLDERNAALAEERIGPMFLTIEGAASVVAR